MNTKKEKDIPHGVYCYDKEKVCPYYQYRDSIEGWCDKFGGTILDQVKDCGINKGKIKWKK